MRRHGTEVEGYRILRKTVGQTEMETLVDNTGSTELSYMDSSDLQQPQHVRATKWWG